MRDVAFGMAITLALLVPCVVSMERKYLRRIEALSMYVGSLEEQLRGHRVGAMR